MKKTSEEVRIWGAKLKLAHFMEVLDKTTIENWILPYLSTGKRGKDIKVAMTDLIDAILYKLKTGCQWRQLPVKQFFDA